MRTAIDILKEATDRVSNNLNRKITFLHGEIRPVVNYITEIQKTGNKVYPAVIIFKNGMWEKRDDFWIEFSVPKVAICSMTVTNASDDQRKEAIFDPVIYPIFDSFESELKKLYFGYNFKLQRSDKNYSKELDEYNQLVDGCIFPITNMKVVYEQCDFRF